MILITTRAPRSLLTAGSVCLCALACLCTAGCGGRSDAEERVVNIYNWADYIGKDTIAQFERKTGIRVVYDTYDSDETLEARMMAGDSGYDIVSTSTDYFSRQIKADIYQELDRSKLPGWHNLDPEVLAEQAAGDPGNRHAMPYLRHVNGFAYNRDLVKARMPDAPLDSLDLLFKPQIIARFADCGVTFLDSAEDVLQLALNYLHLDPNTTRIEDYKRAAELILTVRPYVRAFDSTEYMNGLATGEFCISMSWSGDYGTIKARARAAGINLPLQFTIPKEGANASADALLIPKDAPHPEAAYEFLRFILEPRVIAQVTNHIHYANNNLAANMYVDPQILNDPAVYTPAGVRARLYQSTEVSPALERIRTRTWTRIKTAQ
jgi:putrescine transport system substrate-binding protein